jgi:hypothetical protein
MTAFMPEPHILLTVVAPTAKGRPGADGCLAGRRLALRPAGSTQPNTVSSMSAGVTPLRSSAALDRGRAQFGRGGLSLRSPWKPPIGVRAEPTMTMGSCNIISKPPETDLSAEPCATRRRGG